MADDKNQKPMMTLGMSMRRFGRNLMRHYDRTMSEPQEIDRQVKPYQSMSTSPLNWDNIVTPKRNNRETPLVAEPIQDEIPEQYTPPPQPRRQAHPPQKPIQRQPAPPKKRGLDPRLKAILDLHNQRDAERAIQRKERLAKWEEAHEQGDSQQPSPNIPGWKSKPRASFDYIETSTLIKDEAEKPKQEKIQRDADDSLPASRSKIVEEQDFSQPEMEEGYIAANEPSWDDVDDDFEDLQRTPSIESPYSDFNNDFQETERITPIDTPFTDIDTSKNIKMPASKQGATTNDASPEARSVQRQADEEALSDKQVVNDTPTQYIDAQSEDVEQTFESPATQSPDTSQGYFERRKPRPQRSMNNQRDTNIQRKVEAKLSASPRQNETSDTESSSETHESDEDLSEPSQGFATHDAQNNLVQRQSDETLGDAEDASSSNIDNPANNLLDKTVSIPAAPIQRQTDDDWEDDFDTQIVDTSDHTPSQVDNNFTQNDNYSQIDNTPSDKSRPVQRQTDKQVKRDDSNSNDRTEYSRPVNSVNEASENDSSIQAESNSEQDEAFADNHAQDVPKPIQRELDVDAPHYSDASQTNNPPRPNQRPVAVDAKEDTFVGKSDFDTQVTDTHNNISYEQSSQIQRQPDVEAQQEVDAFSDNHDFSSPIEDSVQRQADESWDDDSDTQVIDNVDYEPSDSSSQVQRQLDRDFTDNGIYLNIDNGDNVTSDSPHPIQRQKDNRHQPEHNTVADNTPYSSSENPNHAIQRRLDNEAQENDSFFVANDDNTYPSNTSSNEAPQQLQRQKNNYQNDENNRDAHSETGATPANIPQPIQRATETDEGVWFDDDGDTQLIDTVDNTNENSTTQRSLDVNSNDVSSNVDSYADTIQHQADTNWNDNRDYAPDYNNSPVDTPTDNTPQRPIQRRQASQADDSPRQQRSDKTTRRIQRDPDAPSTHNLTENTESIDFPANDNSEFNSPIVQRSMGADGEMVYNVVEPADHSLERQTDSTSNLHQALIDAGIVPVDSPSPDSFEQSSTEVEHSISPQDNFAQSTVQRTPEEQRSSSPANNAEQVKPTNSKSSEIVQRQMGADGEMYYNKAQDSDTLPEQPIDVFQGLMQAGMISPQDNPAFNTDFGSADNTNIQRTPDEGVSDIGISQDIQNAMLQRLRDRNNDIMREKAQAYDTQDDIQRTPESINPTYTASVQRTPPIDMLMREEFIDDDSDVDDVEKLTRDVYRLLSNRLRDEAERRNRK